MANPMHNAVQGALPRSPGQPLAGATRQEMEGRFGHDFGSVRVRVDAGVGATLRSLGARARTVGEEISFAHNQYRPETREGAHLLTHELTHVVQQRRGGRMPVRDTTAPSELEAEHAAASAEKGAPIPEVTQGTAVGAAFQSNGDGMTAAHAGGAMGEADAAFVLGQRGFEIVLGPAGAGGHQLTEAGLDIVAYNPRSDETWVVDNKASGGTSTVQSSSAITTNLQQNLRTAIAQIRTLPPFAHQARVVEHLEAALDAVSKGNPLPAKVRLKISGAGGYHSGISRKLRNQEIGWEDLTGSVVRDARKQDIARARSQGVRTGRPVTHQTGSGEVASGTSSAVADTAVVRAPLPAASSVDEPPVATGSATRQPAVTSSGSSSGVNFRAGAAAGALSLAEGVGTILINQYLHEHFAEYRAEGVRHYIDEALEKADPQFEEAIRRHRTEIEKAQAEGRHVYLRFVVQVGMVDTTDRDPFVGSGLSIGDVAYNARVKDVQVFFEGGPEPETYRPDTNVVGDLVRSGFGVSLRYDTRTIQIQGTNMAARRRSEVIREVDAMMRNPERPFEFEKLLVKSLHAAASKEILREYAGYKRELSAASPFIRGRQASTYWARMEALVDAPIAELITQAKIAFVSLDELRQFAVEQRILEEKSGNPHAAAHWTDMIHLIDAPLDERFHAERQRSAWELGPSEGEVNAQEHTVAALERRKSELEGQLSELSRTDARTQIERATGEPPHPPWAKIDQTKKQIKALTEAIYVEERLLRAMKKP